MSDNFQDMRNAKIIIMILAFLFGMLIGHYVELLHLQKGLNYVLYFIISICIGITVGLIYKKLKI